MPARLRPQIKAFYDVVRAADDLADDPDMRPDLKARALDGIEAGLRGDPSGDARALALRDSLSRGGHAGLERHALSMMTAFRADVAAQPCADWPALRGYCRHSADPVGRFVLALHGEGARAHAASDALCTALQVLNHLQDLGEDWRDLGRVYLPLSWLRAAGADVDDLSEDALTPALRMAVDRTLAAVTPLLDRADTLPGRLRSRRLAAEVRVIATLARRLHARLAAGDPLAARIAPGRGDWMVAALRGGATLLAPRLRQPARPVPGPPE